MDKNNYGHYNPDDIKISTYGKMLKDPQVAAALDIIRLAVLANDWNISYEGDKPTIREECVPFLENELEGVNEHTKSRKGINAVIWEMLTAIAYGFGVGEIVLGRPKRMGDYIHLEKIKVLDPESIDRMKTDKHGNLRQVVQSSYGGFHNPITKAGTVELHPDKLLLWSYNMEFGNWWGKSDFRRIYPSWFIKTFLVKFWNIATEKFAMPYIVGQAPDDDLVAMENELKKLQKRSILSIGPNKNVELLKGVVDRGAFLEAIQYHDRKIMTGLLIPTLILEQEEVGAYSLGKTHFSTFVMRIRSIQNQMEDLLNSLVKVLVDLNFKDIDVYPKFKFDEPDRGDLDVLLNAYSTAINTNLADPVYDHVWMREKLGFPEADPSSTVVNPPQPMMDPAMGGGGAPPPAAGSGGTAPDQSGGLPDRAPSSQPVPVPTTGSGKANALKPLTHEEAVNTTIVKQADTREEILDEAVKALARHQEVVA